MSGCLEAVGAHDRDGDMGVAHQESEDGKQDRKDENRSMPFEGSPGSSNASTNAYAYA